VVCIRVVRGVDKSNETVGFIQAGKFVTAPVGSTVSLSI
jgi:hypothetical protein